MLRHDREGVLRIAPSQSAVASTILTRAGLPSAPGTIVLVEADRVSLRSTASLRIARRLGLPWSLASVLLWVPAWLRDPVYAVVARNRLRWFGRRDTCRIPTPDEASRFL
jgi:predicted DCC family thiol-disulfide oxidoreductase YuxK